MGGPSPGALALLVLAIADGATAMSDLAMLWGLRTVFASVASTTIVWRTINRVGPAELRDLRSFGFHPLLAIDTERREVLAQLVRPGNAGSNTAADHAEVVAAAIDALPGRDRAGHRWNDDPADAVTEIVIRADAAGQTHWLAEDAAEWNCWFSLGYGIDDWVRTGVSASTDDDWTPAIGADGSHRDGAEVFDLSVKLPLAGGDEVDRSPGTTPPRGPALVVRRHQRPPPHRPHHRPTGDPAVLEHRQRGAVEDVIRDLKACGYRSWPRNASLNNQTPAVLAATAFNLLSRAQRLTLSGRYQTATPKTIR